MRIPQLFFSDVNVKSLPDCGDVNVNHELIVKLPDDVLVNILMRLSCKDAIRCKSLNKKFRDMVSDPKFTLRHALCSPQREVNSFFHCSLIHRRIIRSIPLSPNMPRRVVNSIPLCPTPRISQTFPTFVNIPASCNGLLLLQFGEFQTLCIFNPTSGSHKLIPYPIRGRNPSYLGLIVDVSLDSGFRFEVVAAIKCNPKSEKLKFMTWKSDTNAWNSPSRDYDLKGICSCVYAINQPVCVSRCLYWLVHIHHPRKDMILKYDVESENPSIINWPYPQKSFRPLIGVADGRLAIVLTFEEVFEIHLYDSLNETWALRERCRGIECGLPVFYCGEHLYVFVKRTVRDIPIGYVFLYDKCIEDWRKIWEVEQWWKFESQRLTPCICNLLNVSDGVYEKVQRFNLSEAVNNFLHGKKVTESLSRLRILLRGKYDSPYTFRIGEVFHSQRCSVPFTGNTAPILDP